MIKEMIEAGFPVIPCIDKNNPLLKHKILDDELLPISAYSELQLNAPAIAIKTGNKQTQIECIDFDLKNDDTKQVWNGFTIQADLTGLYIESTPSGGYHVIYKTEYSTPPSEKLAYPKKGEKATIETRGRGGYVVIAPSPGYKRLHGDITELLTLSKDQVDELKTICKSFNLRPEKTYTHHRESHTSRIYNKIGCQKVLDYLILKGWSVFKEHKDKYWLSRPGKEKFTSATLYKDRGYLYVFTTSTTFSGNTSYSPFDILKLSENLSTDQAEKKVYEIFGEKFTKEIIYQILRNEDKLKEIDLTNELKKSILENMSKFGEFFTDGINGYYFYNCKLIPVDHKSNDRINRFVFSEYGLVESQSHIKTVFDSIEMYAKENGKKTVIHTYSYFNGDVVYVDNFNGKVWKISDKDIDLVDNGTDGIMFLETDSTPVVYDEQSIDIGDILFGGLKIEQTALSIRDQMDLVYMWIMSIYFMKDNKPIVCCVGEKGSGKSELLKKIIYMLFGNVKNLAILSDKEEDFWAAVTNSRVMIFDNADSHKHWLNDALAVCATGATRKIRTLYKTNVLNSTDINCFLGLTSRTPKFTRDDVSDRLLLIRLLPIGSWVPEIDIMEMIKENRNAFMSSIFNDIKSIIPRLREKSKPTQSRMADFESFCIKANPEMSELFLKLICDQKEFSEDLFTDVFRIYCKESFDGRIIKTASDLSMELTRKVFDLKLRDLKLSSHVISQRMKRAYDFCTIKKIDAGHGRKAMYEINSINEETK